MPKHALPRTGPYGIDLTAPGGIAALLAHHRTAFGDVRMETDPSGDPAPPAPETPPPPPTPAAPANPPAGPPAQPATPPAPASEKVEDLPDWAQRIIRDTRAEAATNRTGKTTAEQRMAETVKAFAKAAGIEIPDDDDKPDPAKLTQQLTATQTQARQSAVELAVYKAASKHTGDPDALLDSRAFLTKVGDLDPTADDFAAKIDGAIKDAVEHNPKLKAGRAPGSSSVDHAGGTGEGHTTRTPKPLDQAVAGHYGT